MAHLSLSRIVVHQRALIKNGALIASGPQFIKVAVVLCVICRDLQTTGDAMSLPIWAEIVVPIDL